MKQADKKAVLFIDLLGFGSLIDEYPVDVDDLTAYDRPSHQISNILSETGNRLASMFWNFHYSLKWAIETARYSHSITAISFSDSAFIAADRLDEAVKLGISLTQSLLRSGIPVRAGIAYGTFAAIRFKSDITLDSAEHAAHFLGTGIVGAHQAESCGTKGIRILLHPSVSPLLDSNIPVMALQNHERRNRVGVQHEIDYWSFNVTDGRAAWHSLQDLWDNAPGAAQIHYESTAEAVNRMRMRQGFEPLTNLRRRTLTTRRVHPLSEKSSD